ncbi:MAG TPA: DUF1579 family protein [Phycisphaerae bacterium]|nr:DUF1579 family protein [Phycisphaerae bacterium]
MTRGTLRLALVAMCGFAFGAALVAHADDDDDKPKGQDPMNDPKMAAIMKYSQPGPEHGALQQLVGDWDQQVKWRMTPDSPWVTSTSECENELVLGGRFVRSTIESKDDDGFEYMAIGYTGFDTYRKKYVATWMDNMTTMINFSDGSYDPTARMFMFLGTTPDFETGKTKHYRSQLTIHHKDAMTEQVFETDANGQEFMSLEIHYKRD